MNNSIAELLDVLAWIIGGLFVGLIILGAYNFYQEYQNSSVPSLSITPIKEDKIQPEREEKNFQPIDEFHLVRKHSPRETTENKKSETNSQSEDNKSETHTAADSELPVTNLPYKLTGTTTGAAGFNAATVRQRKGNESRVVTSGDSWNEFQVLTIKESYIVIRNNKTNKRERLPLDDQGNE